MLDELKEFLNIPKIPPKIKLYSTFLVNTKSQTQVSSYKSMLRRLSNTKKVFFQKPYEDLAVYKILDSNLYLTIYNKAPPQIKYFRKAELVKLVKIQRKLKGNYIRDCERSVDRLKVRDCLLEIMLLLTGKAYDHAIKKITFKKLQKEFHDPFNNINDELRFEDKLQFKLPNRYYNFSNINQPSAPN